VIDLRDLGESGADQTRVAAERIVGQLSIQAIKESDHPFEPLRNLAWSVATYAQAQFAEVGRSAVSMATSFDRELAEDAARMGQLFAASATSLPQIPSLPQVRVSPAMRAELDALKSYLYGDGSVFRSYVEERIGTNSAPIRVRLHHHIDSCGDDLPLGYLPFLLTEYKMRFEQQKIANGLSRKTAEVRQGINTSRHPSVNLALTALSKQGQTREQVLSENIPGIAYIEAAEPSSRGYLSGRVANQLRREGIERPHKPGAVMATDPEDLTRLATRRADEQELIVFAYRELIARKTSDSGLSQRELESWVFGELFGNQEAAEVLGRSPNQIAQEKLRAKRKISRSA
jgi:hypothetical protein